jgi:hypothetical protein
VCLNLLVRDLVSVLRSEDDGIRGAGNRVAILAVLDNVAVQRRELDIVVRDPGSASDRSVRL